MAGLIEQFEYRWQPTKDLTLIAGSIQPSEITAWAGQIALWVRHPPADYPAESMRYEIFDDGFAALAWRQRTGQVDELEAGVEGRPEVSRVLLGQEAQLHPGLAIAVCRAGLSETVLGSAPGTVSARTLLPKIDATQLDQLARSQVAVLDAIACDERCGLYKVVAAALTEPDTPLAIQLPDRLFMLPLQECWQLPILWGLWRVLTPLLRGEYGQRKWSFSTFEQPLGKTDTSALADIVFRAQKVAHNPSSTRPEIVVRPLDGSDLPDRIRYREFAGLLVDAYRYLGADKLAEHLDAVSGTHESLEERIAVAGNALSGILPREAVSEWLRQPPATEWWSGTMDDEPGYEQPPAEQLSLPVPDPEENFEPGIPPAATRGDGTDRAVTVTQAASARSHPLSGLLRELYAGPADPAFESALRELRIGQFPDLPDDRAVARRMMAEHDWYVPVLVHDGTGSVDETLAAIFRHCVIPDLGDPEVADEIAGWAEEQSAPPIVIKALRSAARARAGAPDMMDKVTEAPLGRRWLAEQGIDPRVRSVAEPVSPRLAGPSAPAVSPAAAAGRGQHERAAHDSGEGQNLLDALAHSDPTRMLALFCVVLIGLLVLSLVH
jgi:hypothetical protein